MDDTTLYFQTNTLDVIRTHCKNIRRMPARHNYIIADSYEYVRYDIRPDLGLEVNFLAFPIVTIDEVEMLEIPYPYDPIGYASGYISGEALYISIERVNIGDVDELAQYVKSEEKDFLSQYLVDTIQPVFHQDTPIHMEIKFKYTPYEPPEDLRELHDDTIRAHAENIRRIIRTTKHITVNSKDGGSAKGDYTDE